MCARLDLDELWVEVTPEGEGISRVTVDVTLRLWPDHRRRLIEALGRQDAEDIAPGTLRAIERQLALAAKMRVPIQRVSGIVSGRRAVTAETATLLSRALGTTPELWLNLQVAVDLWDAQQRMPRSRAGRVVARAHAPARSVHRRNR